MKFLLPSRILYLSSVFVHNISAISICNYSPSTTCSKDLSNLKAEVITRLRPTYFSRLHVHKVSHPPLQNLLQHGLAFVFVITPYRRELIDYNPCDRIEWDSDEYSNKFITSAGIKERTYTEREMDLLWDHEQSVIAKGRPFLLHMRCCSKCSSD